MYNCNYPNLFTPIRLGNTMFRNRIFASPTSLLYSSDGNHHPIPESMAYFERKALGGAGCVCVGDATVDSVHGMHGRFCAKMDDPLIMPALNKLSSLITRHGAVASLEVFHAGAASTASYNYGNEIYGPVECVSESVGFGTTRAKAIDRAMMDIVVRQHENAAAMAKSCGYGMVTLHGAHGFLIHQFMSPTLNHRTDEYGGSFENRMRFPLELVRAVRAAVGPGFPIELRISGSEVYEGGYGIDYGCRIAEAFDGLVDLIHVSAGSHEDVRVYTVTHPSMFLEDGVNVKYAAEIRKHVKQSKVATVGALADPELLEEIIASGKADVVELARGLICDPDIPVKARTGRGDQIRRCMRCFTCYSNLVKHGHIVCALNPEISNEYESKFEKPAAEKKKVLIAGGGVAGMEAALACAHRGHEVVLCEKTGRLGGVLRCEEKVPFKKYLHTYLDQQAALVSRGKNIDVRLNTQVTRELAEALAPDVIIAAVGSKPLIPGIKGIDGPNVVGAEAVYLSPEKAGHKIVILGGGLVGSELAIHLGDMGRDVTILEMLPALNAGDNIFQGMSINVELSRLDTHIATGTKAIEITDKGVLGEDAEGQKFFEADTVICALGLLPLREEADALRLCAPEFYQIGDCSAARNIYEATRTAHQIAADIGRKLS
jgi:2,4-dienoyl-CoA reductase-like NADH-dependent reductase (Old Yellow Enzyme family)/thioredoxin reductase